MSIPSSPIKARRNVRAGRAVLGTVLLVALAILAVDIQDAQADVVVAATNYVLNGSFEGDKNGDGTPNKWSEGGAAGSGDKRVCDQSHDGSCSYKMVGSNNIKWLGQCRNFTGTDAGNTFKIKAWTKTKALKLGGGEATIYIDFWNGSTYVSSASRSIPGGTAGWTLRQVSATAAADYDQICIFLHIDANSGTIWWDHVSMVYTGGP